MKMITAIVNRKDSGSVCNALTREGFYFTKIATSGGFLKAGNITLLMGTEDDRVEEALNIIRQHCSTREVSVPSVVMYESSIPSFTSTVPATVTVGGATVFITDIEYFEKM